MIWFIAHPNIYNIYNITKSSVEIFCVFGTAFSLRDICIFFFLFFKLCVSHVFYHCESFGGSPAVLSSGLIRTLSSFYFGAGRRKSLTWTCAFSAVSKSSFRFDVLYIQRHCLASLISSAQMRVTDSWRELNLWTFGDTALRLTTT